MDENNGEGNKRDWAVNEVNEGKQMELGLDELEIRMNEIV